MKDITLSITDRSGVVDTKRLNTKIKSCSGLLEACVRGENDYCDSLGWHRTEQWAGEQMLSQIESLAAQVRADADALVVVGVGGSNQAARAVIDAIGEKSGVRIIWAGNSLSADSICRVKEELRDKRFFVNIIAKNFETLEPGVGYRAMRQALLEQYGEDYHKHVICTGTRGSRLHRLCLERGYFFLPFPDDIGGRFSSLSPVGLFPLAVAGLDIRAMVGGARHMENRLKTEAAESNPALRYAAIRNILFTCGYRIEMMSFFEPRLYRLSRWWMQLFGESEGKNDRGLFPATGSYSEDLHSIGQYVQQGTPIMFETFLVMRAQDASFVLKAPGVDDGFEYLDCADLYEINRTACEATLEAHAERFPCVVIGADRFDEETFGQLFYFFEFACYLSARMLGVDPFSQPGVEAYKQRMFAKLGKDTRNDAFEENINNG